jgi:flagellar hook-associated protein 3 FlgL
MNDANEVMATQKQINSIGDDPIGFSQVLDLNASISNLEQYNANIDMGISWLSSAESAIDTIQDQVINAKTLAIQLANASASATERSNAVESIEGIIDQILSMANTQVNGSYIFGGTQTDTEPFAYDDNDDPGAVVYSGNDTAFTIQANSSSTIEVGRDGDELFLEDEIVVDSTNNKVFF